MSTVYLQVDWLKNQFTSLRTPWEEGHMKIKVGHTCLYASTISFITYPLQVRRSDLLEDAVNSFLDLDAEDMLKMFRYEFIGDLHTILPYYLDIYLTDCTTWC